MSALGDTFPWSLGQNALCPNSTASCSSQGLRELTLYQTWLLECDRVPVTRRLAQGSEPRKTLVKWDTPRKASGTCRRVLEGTLNLVL